LTTTSSSLCVYSRNDYYFIIIYTNKQLVIDFVEFISFFLLINQFNLMYNYIPDDLTHIKYQFRNQQSFSEFYFQLQ